MSTGLDKTQNEMATTTSSSISNGCHLRRDS